MDYGNVLGFKLEVNEEHKYALMIQDPFEKEGLKKIHTAETLEQIKDNYNAFYVFTEKAHIQRPFPIEIYGELGYRILDELMGE